MVLASQPNALHNFLLLHNQPILLGPFITLTVPNSHVREQKLQLISPRSYVIQYNGLQLMICMPLASISVQLQTLPSAGKPERSLLMQFTVTYMEMPHNKSLPSLMLPKSQYFTDKHKKMQVLLTIQRFTIQSPSGRKHQLVFWGK